MTQTSGTSELLEQGEKEINLVQCQINGTLPKANGDFAGDKLSFKKNNNGATLVFIQLETTYLLLNLVTWTHPDKEERMGRRSRTAY